MSKFAIVVAPDSKIYEPEMLKDKAIATTPNNGSDFTTLKMMEGFLAQEHIKRVHTGSMLKRLEAVRDGKVAAVEPDGALDQRGAETGAAHPDRVAFDPQRGGRRRSRRPDAREDVPGAGARGGRTRQDPTPYIHYFIAETGGLLEPHDFQIWRLLHAPPHPTRASGSTTPTTGRSSGT